MTDRTNEIIAGDNTTNTNTGANRTPRGAMRANIRINAHGRNPMTGQPDLCVEWLNDDGSVQESVDKPTMYAALEHIKEQDIGWFRLEFVSRVQGDGENTAVLTCYSPWVLVGEPRPLPE